MIFSEIEDFSEVAHFCKNIFRNRGFFRKFPVCFTTFSEIGDFSENFLYCPLRFFPKSKIFEKIFLYHPLAFFPKSGIFQNYSFPFSIFFFRNRGFFKTTPALSLFFFSEIWDF